MSQLKHNKFNFKKTMVIVLVLSMVVSLLPVTAGNIKIKDIQLKNVKLLLQAQALGLKPAAEALKPMTVAPKALETVSKIPVTGGMPVADIGQSIWNFLKEMGELIWYNRKEIGANIYKSGLSNIVRNIARDSAVYLATGDKAQAPLFQTNFVNYLEQEGDAFVGNAINNELKRMWGVNLCEPIDPLFKVKFQIAAREYMTVRKPNCSFSLMAKNIGDMRHLKLVDLPKMADMFNPRGNELGMFFSFTSQVQGEQKKKAEFLKMEELMGQGWKSLKSKVSGNVLTPATYQKFSSEFPHYASMMANSTFTGYFTADFIGPFVNTYIAKLMERWMKGKIVGPEYSSSGYNNVFSKTTSPIQAAKERFADLGRPNYNFHKPLDIMSKLSCDNTDTQYDCVIDDAFVTALSETPHITVREAINNNLLDEDRAFGYWSDGNGGTATADKKIYSYRSLVILRKYRIIPVGWELAAEYYKNFDKSGQTLTLKKLINNYGSIDSPYYRLVDPNWVLKAPETICEREGAGEEVASVDTSGSLKFRLPYCADERSCIKERSDGNGCLYYGYCTEEKPIWRIHSDNGECAPVYNSCRAYTTREGQKVAYLNNTVWGRDICDASNVGCREYANSSDDGGSNWNAGRIYLNKNAGDNVCDKTEQGCSQFIRLKEDGVFLDDSNGDPVEYEEALTALQAVSDSNYDNLPDGDGHNTSNETFDTIINYDFSTKTNLKKAPDYLGCDGYTIDTGDDKASCLGTNFWRRDIQKCVENGNDECANYILYCDINDAGCQFYIPQSYKGPQVPGIAGDADYCPAECVSYRSYMKQPSFLEPTVPADKLLPNLIADTATTCSAVDNGCEEFTNLSEGVEGENKEYFSSIRSCILPNNSNVGTYYSWASTDEAGNQLKSWQLLATNSSGTGMPCTNSETASDGTVSCIDNTTDPNTGFFYGPYQCNFGNVDPTYNPVYNPDCVEYIDATGVSYWVLYSRVIPTSDGCVPMRRTNGGAIYSINQEQSQRCGEQAKNCREYKGSAANNIKIVLNDDFEDGTQDWSGGVISTEALTAGGQSLYIAPGNDFINKDVVDILERGKSYKLSFWAKGVNSTVDEISFTDGGSIVTPFNDNPISFNNEWNYYELSLNNFDRVVATTEYLWFDINTGGFYIDNIILTETTDDLYLIADSWQTPASCDDPAEGAMVGCEAYQDVNKQNWYLKSFTKLCYDEMVGCEAMIDTYNNDVSTSTEFNLSNTDSSDNVVVPADKLAYLVYDGQKKCHQVGCTKLGLVEANRDSNAPINYTDKYLVVETEKFGKTVVSYSGQQEPGDPLCLVEENWCDEFARDSGDSEYFMNPSVFTCEYKVANNNYGWYENGTNDICPIAVAPQTGYCLGGRSVLNDDTDNSCDQASDCSDYARGSQPGQCSAWVGICPIEQDNCTEYQDPAHPTYCDKQSVYGEAYDSQYNNGEACDFYYYKSDKVEGKNSSNDCVKGDLGDGCQAFHRTDGGEDVYYSTKRCTADTQVECEDDYDCVRAGGDSLGKCKYVAQ